MAFVFVLKGNTGQSPGGGRRPLMPRGARHASRGSRDVRSIRSAAGASPPPPPILLLPFHSTNILATLCEKVGFPFILLVHVILTKMEIACSFCLFVCFDCSGDAL